MTGDPKAFIDTVFDATSKNRIFQTKGFYRTKIFGIFRKNFMPVSFDYCPFCGEKYDNVPNKKLCRIKLKRDKVTREADFHKGHEVDAFMDKGGNVYIEDGFGEKIFLKPRDYVKCSPGRGMIKRVAKISLDRGKLFILRRALSVIEEKIDDTSLSQEFKLMRVNTLLLEAEWLIASMITVEYKEVSNG
jgi:hypothetical protein